MKKVIFLLLSGIFIFASCSSNEGEVIEQSKKELLKSYTLKRGADGAYSIDFNVANNTNVDSYKLEDTSNNIILSEANSTNKTKYNNNFSIENDFLKIGFLEANSNKETKIYIEDENSTFANKGVTEFLNSYSISSNEDGTYTLDFIVNDNVQTYFEYNAELEVYKVHLSNGKAKQKEFSRQLEVHETNTLRLDFVNHKYSKKAKNLEKTIVEKPKVIILK